jgi:hypothetical protein
MSIDLRPSTVDPLDASATPITPDPVVRTSTAPGRGWTVRGNVTRDEMVRRYVAAGLSQQDAERLADEELARSGDRPRGLYDQDNTPEGNAALAQRVQGDKRAKDRQARFESDYNEATGAPVGPDIAPPALAPDDIPLTPEQLRAKGYNPMREPGVRMPDGSRVAPPQPLYTEREARDYNIRTPVGDGMYTPSGRDRDMEARGYRPVTNPDGTVAYRLSPTGGVDGLPGTPGRAGQRHDMEAPMLDETGNRIIGPDGQPVAKFNTDVLPGPISQNNVVYKQTDLARRRQAAYNSERQLYRMAAAANMTPAEFRAKHPELFTDLEVPVGPGASQPNGQGQFIAQQGAPAAQGAAKPQLVRSGVGARMEVQAARQADAEKRESAWRSQMMLAGRNPAKNAVNAFNALGDPAMNDWQRAVMANALRPDMDNTTPLTVDAMGAQNAMRLLNGINLGAAGGLGGPAAGIAADAAKQQRRDRAKTEFDTWHQSNVGTRAYSQGDHDRMVNYMMNQYGLSRPEAEAIAQSHGRPVATTPAKPPDAVDALEPSYSY